MTVRLAIIAIGAAASAVVAGAQPRNSRNEGQQAKAPAPATVAPVILASASDVRRPAATDAEPVRHPAPRVTTCRCGDQQAESEQPEQ